MICHLSPLQFLLVHLGSVTGDPSLGTAYKPEVQNFLKGWIDGSNVIYTPEGLAWRSEWGSLRYTGNVAFLALLAAKEGILYDNANGDRYHDWAKTQIDYMLGDNPNGFSYQVGYGTNFPKQPHHKAA